MQTIQKFLVCAALLAAITACGGEDPVDFTGTWDVQLALEDNNCPFAANQSLGQVSPLTVNRDAGGNFEVRNALGELATGSQGIGEVVSFTAKAPAFGSFGSTAPFTCTAAPYVIGYLDQGSNKAQVTAYITLTNCTAPGVSRTTSSCSVFYSGDATRR